VTNSGTSFDPNDSPNKPQRPLTYSTYIFVWSEKPNAN